MHGFVVNLAFVRILRAISNYTRAANAVHNLSDFDDEELRIRFLHIIIHSELNEPGFRICDGGDYFIVVKLD